MVAEELQRLRVFPSNDAVPVEDVCRGGDV